ncbi:hypothetical protein L226DRAFT_565768 [Lentinus tigrinus ALCF2SS1-7]|uniref:Uncharacterized protein n=1 Tax=Lentinus tigrinus ALCF2SS1-6 TaxID=1328759 RepID=A0A5C2SV81_9APHY|nr:hypothetical protein L227DRAFT_605430 [Lentinus tigrinus ALCF2SS1-6]RPD80949.1 hypothetical protein L226DRAFT_565768 [Lentinus tigrinus ALCF2SS1-7]
MPPRTRPGPLQEMDLRLVPVPTPYGTPSHSRPNKRPHSPSVGSFDSPAKRRLKAEGGLNTPRLKSPLSASSNSARFAPAHFHALLQGPDSPAVRLDFGSSEASDATVCETPRGGGSGTPRRSPKRTPSTRVRRSPRLSARTPGSPPRSTGSNSHGQNDAENDSAAIRAPRASPMRIPREVSPPDRQSIHYPGFDVYQDRYIVIPVARKPDPAEHKEHASLTFDKEQDKENRAPRRKSSKKIADPATPSETARAKAGLTSPSASVKSSTKKPAPASPHPKHVTDYLSALATPRERILRPVVSPAVTLVGATPGRTPLGKEERRRMRRAMEEEMDFIDGDGEDELL